jgi:hypothetical protein
VDTVDTVLWIERIVAEHIPANYDGIRKAFHKICCEAVAIKPKEQWTRQELFCLGKAFRAGLSKAGIEISAEELKALVGDIWKGLRFSGGKELFKQSWLASEGKPVPKCARHFADERMGRLAAWCAALHTACGGKFILPCRKVATYFGLASFRQASVWMEMLVDADVLAIVEKPTVFFQGERVRSMTRGYRYVFIGEV